MAIKNVVFDVGNVLVRWDPHAIIQLVFPEYDPVEFYAAMQTVWLDLNAGKCSEEKAAR